MPLVSIITPCYNSGEYLPVVIDSVIAQTFNDWEMIIVDDGSTDNSRQVIEDYIAKDSRIRYYRLEKSSGSPAKPRNMAIDYAKGKYIAFLDSDDVWLADKLQCQVDFAEKNNYHMVFSYYEKISPSGERKNRVVKSSASYNYNQLLKSNSILWLTLLITKEAIGNDRFLNTDVEDYIFLLTILKKGYIAHNTQKLHALYRESKSSRSGNKFQTARFQWNIYRKHLHLGFFTSLYYFAHYAFYGLKKYMI